MYSEYSFGPVRPYRETMGNFLPALADFYAHPEKYAEEPFRIFGNLWYVGDRKVCMHLVDTGDGLILFDTGYSHTYEMLLQSIREAGFDPMDIRYIIHSHGHFDHFGSGDRLREMTKAEVLMSGVDTRLLKEEPARALCHLAPGKDERICWPDRLIEDGDVIALGNTAIRCVLSPGHTWGTMSFFFDVFENGAAKRAAYFGGVGFLTVYREYCREYGLPEGKCEAMGRTIARLKKEKADIVLGNHPNQNCTLEKRAFMKEHPEKNPFVNPAAWGMFLDGLEARRQTFAELGY